MIRCRLCKIGLIKVLWLLRTMMTEKKMKKELKKLEQWVRLDHRARRIVLEDEEEREERIQAMIVLRNERRQKQQQKLLRPRRHLRRKFRSLKVW